MCSPAPCGGSGGLHGGPVRDLLEILTSTALFAAAVRLAVPVLLAALGETFAERGGMVNVGLEAMMLAGACGGVLGSYAADNWLVGVAVGVACGVAVAAVQACFAVNLHGDQIVSGIALNITVLGLTGFLARTVWEAGNVPQVAHTGALRLPGLAKLPVLGPVLFRQNPLVYVTLAIAVVSWWVLVKTRWGLELRGCGEDPRACDSLGIPVLTRRWQVMAICGALAGLGGVVIALTELYTWADGMSGGRGFIALAVVIIARWSPARAVLAALLFGGCQALALRMQATSTGIPYELLLTLPYVVTLLVYAGVVGRTIPPAALGRPYARR
jgi:general nucleoside transport system permease protein